MISSSVFDRVVGRAQASKRTLERLDNDLPGAQNDVKMALWRPPGGSRGWLWTLLGPPGRSGALLGASWSALGTLLDRPCALLAASWAALGRSRSDLGAIWERLGPIWERLGPILHPLKTALARLGAILSESLKIAKNHWFFYELKS